MSEPRLRRLVGTFLLIALFVTPDAFAALSKDQQKCVNAMNKSLGKVDKTWNKEICNCIKDFAKGKGVSDIPDCIAQDRKGKIGKAEQKTLDDEQKKCVGNDKNGAPKAPSVFYTSATNVNQAAKDKALRMLEILFGSDVNGTVLTELSDKNGSKCQQKIAKDLKNCEETRLKEFGKCKKNALKEGKDPFPAGAVTAAELEQCIFDDPKEKIAKKCDLPGAKPDKIRKDLDKSCVAKSQDLCALFPGCCPPCIGNDVECVHACLERPVACATCLAINAADGLAADCDLLDNGQVDGSCGCGDGVLQPGLGEECDDGNLIDEDGCSSECLLEGCGDGVLQPGLGEECEDNGDCPVGKLCNPSCSCDCAPPLSDCGGVCTDLSSDTHNCGLCGLACVPGELCLQGVCACPPGTVSCGGTCVDTQNDPQNCGFCFSQCQAGKLCSLGQCVCPGGQIDCGGLCVDPTSNPNHCGGCGMQCNNPHGSTQCSGGTCTPACDPLWADCNGNGTDGCETSLTSVSNCGVCSAVCNLPNASEDCAAGHCNLLSCANGWCNLDVNPNNGCEHDLDTNPSCVSSTNLPSVDGDIGAQTVSFTGHDERWFRIHIDENNFSSFNCVDLMAQVTLIVPLGTDYDLFAHCDDCVGPDASSTLSGSANESLTMRWDESCVLGVPTGSNSGRFIYIRVAFHSGNVCNNYSLTVRGNTGGGPNTCSTK